VPDRIIPADAQATALPITPHQIDGAGAPQKEEPAKTTISPRTRRERQLQKPHSTTGNAKARGKSAIFRRHEPIPPAQMPHKLVRKANAHRNPSFPGPNQPRRDMEAAEFVDPAVTASGVGARYRAVR
jgi:hypothetical protein